MTTYPSGGRARGTDPSTSHEAAATADISELELLTLHALREHGPGTTEEIGDRVGRDRDSISPRMQPLLDLGLVHDSGVKRPTRKNHNAIVWAIGPAPHDKRKEPRLMSYRPTTDTWILARSKVKYYGAYPAGFLERAREQLCGIDEPLLHLCSGKVRDYPFKGVGPYDRTVDVNPELQPDIVADVSGHPDDAFFKAVAGMQCVLADPPYTKEDAEKYGTAKLPTARRCLEIGLAIVPTHGRVGILHYVAPRAPKGVKFVSMFTVFVGFENRVRVYSVYEKR